MAYKLLLFFMFQIIRTGIDASNRDLAIISNNIANAGTNVLREVRHSLKMFTDST